MNVPDTLDFALGQLEGPALDRATVEAETDPAVRARVNRLTGSIRAMLGRPDADLFDVPSGLAARSRAFVETELARRRTPLEFSPPTRRRLRPEDLAVAATIFLASLLALAPAVFRSREQWGRAACANQLQKVGMRMNQYAAQHETYPFVPADDPVPHAAAIVCRLNESVPIDPADLHCPCTGTDCDHALSIPDMKTVAALYKRSPDEACKAMNLDYALHVGYRNAEGKPRAVPAHPFHMMPLLADKPAFDDAGRILEGNSPNHDGRGQNVYFADGHVAWHPSRRVSPRDGDLYLNRADRPAFGVDSDDAVLLPAPLRVDGR